MATFFIFITSNFYLQKQNYVNISQNYSEFDRNVYPKTMSWHKAKKIIKYYIFKYLEIILIFQIYKKWTPLQYE